VVSLVALFMAISVFASLRRLHVPGATVKVKAVAAVALSIIGPIAQVVLYLALSARLGPYLTNLR